MALKLQDPSDSMTWQHDWSDFLAAGETISDRLWTIDPDESPSLLENATSAAVTVKNLTAGTVYVVSEKITTSAGNIAERSLTIRCEQY